MGTADAHREGIALHQLADQLAALNLGNAQPLRLTALGVVRADGGGVDDHVRAANVRCVMTDEYGNVLFFQVLGLVGFGAVRACDGTAPLLQVARQPRHRASADADEMEAAMGIIVYVRGHRCPSNIWRGGVPPRASYYNSKGKRLQAKPRFEG